MIDARLSSSVFIFTVNKFGVFKTERKESQTQNELVKYYSFVILLMVINYFVIYFSIMC